MPKKFASGKRSRIIDDRSGFEVPYKKVIKEPGTNFIVHPRESDGKFNIVDHPQNYSPKNLKDATSLRWARPETIPVSATTTCVNEGNAIIFANEATSSQMQDSTSSINVIYKKRYVRIYDTTNKRLKTTASLSTDVAWTDLDGISNPIIPS